MTAVWRLPTATVLSVTEAENPAAAGSDQPRVRIGAYLLAGDPVWLASSLSRYYGFLDDLVVVAPEDRLGWTGRPIPVDECLEIVRRLDHRGIARIVWGSWRDVIDPLRADTAQRQAGIDALGNGVDWVLQVDNDELLPEPEELLALLGEADRRSLRAVEWPMRVLFRRLADGSFLQVVGSDGTPRYDYPGPVAVRAGTRVTQARRTEGPLLRAVVRGDTVSRPLLNELGDGEERLECLAPEQAIVHNSWGRDWRAVYRKVTTWGHASGWRGQLYYWGIWLPAPVTWRVLRDFHPFARGLWPRLGRVAASDGLLSEDRQVR